MEGRACQSRLKGLRSRTSLPVDDSGTVETSHTFDDLADVKTRPVAPESPPPSQLGGKIAARMEIQSEVQCCAKRIISTCTGTPQRGKGLTLFVVKRVVQPDDEGIRSVASASFEYRLLRPSVRQLAMRQNLRSLR